MFVNQALVFCLLYFSEAEGELYEDSLIADEITIYMVQENKMDDETKTVKTELNVTEVISKNYRIKSDDGILVSDMIESLENVKRNAYEMNEKISEQQLNLDKLFNTIDPKEMFVHHLSRKLII